MAKRIAAGFLAVVLMVCLASMVMHRFQGVWIILLTIGGIVLGLWYAAFGSAPRSLLFNSMIRINDDDDPSNLPAIVVYPLLGAVIAVAVLLVASFMKI